MQAKNLIKYINLNYLLKFLKTLPRLQYFDNSYFQKMKSIKSPKQIGNFIIDQYKTIGQGTYGKVHIAYKNNNWDQKYACKVISKKPLKNMQIYNSIMLQSTKQQYQRQITFHKKLTNNKHIVKLQDISHDDDAYYLFMQYCDSDLAKKLINQGKFTQAQATDYIKQLCLGYNQIYRAKASHRDLKPQNLLLKNGILKIADFGFVRQLTESLNQSILNSRGKNISKDERILFRTGTMCGTPQYIPPNVIELQSNQKIKYDPQKFDMWSIGIIYYLLLYGKRPFNGNNTQQLYEQIQNKKLEFPEEPQVSTKVKNIITDLLKKNQQQRIQFRLLLNKLNIQQPKKTKTQKTVIQEQINDQNLKQKCKKSIQNKFKFIQFLNSLMNLIYDMNTKYSIFNKIFSEQQKKKHKYFAYKLLTRLHELRKKKNTDLLSTQEFKSSKSKQSINIINQLLAQSQLQQTAEKVSFIIKQYDQNFYQQIKQIIGQFQSLQQILTVIYENLKKTDISQMEFNDLDIQRCYLSLLKLKQYIQNNLKNKKSLFQTIQIKDTQKIIEYIKNCIKS